MSINNIKQEKENKIFKKWDILVYAILLVLIVVLFLVVFISKDDSKIEGFEMSYKNNKILTYDFQKDSFDYNSEFIEINECENGYIILFYLDDKKTDFNKIQVNTQDKCVVVLDASCSTSKDCTSMSIKKISDTIICVPHSLIIKPLGSSNIEDNIVIG